MRRVLRVFVYLFAALGLGGSLLGAYLYVEGRRAEDRLDPKATQVYAEFARRMLAEDAASASVLKMALADGVTIKEAIASMESRAAARNIKLVGRFSMSKESPGRKGKPDQYAEVFQFCDSGTATALLEYNPDFLAHMPCSIGLYQDAGGKGWLITLNLDLLIHGGREIDAELKQRILAVKEGLLDIMAAGATGAL
jgi:uncharacterized protein (DUF302 family)